MKLSELKGRSVVSVSQAHKLGEVDNVVVDLSSRSVLGLLVRTGGLLHSRQAVLLRDVKAIGQDAVTVEDESQLNGQDKFAELKDKPTADAIVGAKVMTESGSQVGSVSDLSVDIPAGQITEYILDEGLLERLRGQERFVPASAVRSLGVRLVVVTDEEPTATTP